MKNYSKEYNIKKHTEKQEHHDNMIDYHRNMMSALHKNNNRLLASKHEDAGEHHTIASELHGDAIDAYEDNDKHRILFYKKLAHEISGEAHEKSKNIHSDDT